MKVHGFLTGRQNFLLTITLLRLLPGASLKKIIRMGSSPWHFINTLLNDLDLLPRASRKEGP
jgi:hypothetical protein